MSGEVLDIHKFSELGKKEVLCLLSDSTNVERPGFTKSERLVGENIDKAFADAEGRVIFASFASNVNRLQQAIFAAFKYHRKVATVGRSMVNVVNIAAEIGNVIEFTSHGAKLVDNVSAGRVFIDGMGIGDIGSSVMKERSLLSQDGILIIILAFDSESNTILTGPDIVTRGFVYVRESNLMLDEVKALTRQTVTRNFQNGIHETNLLQKHVREAVSRHLYDKNKRRPMVIPIFQVV